MSIIKSSFEAGDVTFPHKSNECFVLVIWLMLDDTFERA